MILVSDPAKIGPALAQVRALQGMSRRQCARLMVPLTGRTETSINAQLWTWDAGRNIPDLKSLGIYLKALGFALYLDFEKEET